MMSTGPPLCITFGATLFFNKGTETLKLECQANDIWPSIALRPRYFVQMGDIGQGKVIDVSLGRRWSQ